MPPQPQTVQPQPQGLMRGIGALGSMHNLKRGTRESSLMLMGKDYTYVDTDADFRTPCHYFMLIYFGTP